ncbi:HNH endonuclease signature motif containing protein [Thermoactinomyces sp. CICC 10521]|uniref:HNH endonuclease signature motif containing protein n=1 Tax=Thermoactinomyces sp. CICC 10521 TaxID=2767426 RepID=UPI0018DC416B|nr:HNH endonuclease signature motif containing protein [Thermoactinomyces sp. CICC 10521]MBH8609370.1 HNH endonuclease [Thermoactinomyces sp. CICC 10521]
MPQWTYQVSNNSGKMLAVSKVDEAGVSIRVYTQHSDMEHLWMHHNGRELTERHRTEFIRLEIPKHYDALSYLEMLESVVSNARTHLEQIHQEKANNLQDWRWKIKKRDGKCMVCGTTEQLEAHHIESRAYAKTLELSLANGITLCSEHHNEFHQIYGKGKNDGLQLAEYMDWKKTGDASLYFKRARGSFTLQDYLRKLETENNE